MGAPGLAPMMGATWAPFRANAGVDAERLLGFSEYTQRDYDANRKLFSDPSDLGIGYFLDDGAQADAFFKYSPFQQIAQYFTLQQMSVPEVKQAVQQTHLSSLYKNEKYVQQQTEGLVQASNWFRQFMSSENPDGTFNAYIPYGTSVPVATIDTGFSLFDIKDVKYSTSNYTPQEMTFEPNPNSVRNLKDKNNSTLLGPGEVSAYLSGLDVRNIPKLDDYGRASELVIGGYSPLYSLRKEFATGMANLTGNSPYQNQYNQYGQDELAYTEDFAKRKNEVLKFKKNKEIGKKLASTSQAPGVGGSESEDTLKLGIPNLLGF